MRRYSVNVNVFIEVDAEDDTEAYKEALKNWKDGMPTQLIISTWKTIEDA